jgi:hypothetical protein
MKTTMVFLGFLGFTPAMVVGAGDADRLSMRVSPQVCFSPATLVVRATIASDADNRVVLFVAESPEFYRSSEIQLEGDRAPRTSVVEFRSLPPGLYEVRTVLLGSAGRERASVRQQVNVIASGGRGE